MGEHLCEFRCHVVTAVDMDHHLSGTTYAKAPRGRAITIESSQRQRPSGQSSLSTLDTFGRSTLMKPSKAKGAPSGALALVRPEHADKPSLPHESRVTQVEIQTAQTQKTGKTNASSTLLAAQNLWCHKSTLNICRVFKAQRKNDDKITSS